MPHLRARHRSGVALLTPALLLVLLSRAEIGRGAVARQTFAYVTHEGGMISQYRVNANGTFSPLSPARVRAGSLPGRLAVDPTRQFAYVANSGSGSISQYRIAANGTLTTLQPAAVATGSGADEVAVDPSGRFAYVTVNHADVVLQYRRNGDGTLSPLSPATVPAGDAPTAIEIDRKGRFVYVVNRGGDSISQYRINAEGRLSALSPSRVAAGGGPGDIALAGNGFAYVTTDRDKLVWSYRVNPNGTLSPLSSVEAGNPDGPCCGVSSITIDPSGSSVFVTNEIEGAVWHYRRTPGGQLVPALEYKVSPRGRVFTPGQYLRARGRSAPGEAAIPASAPVSVAVDPTGRFVYIANRAGNSIALQRLTSRGSRSTLSSAVATTPVIPASDRPVAVTLIER